MIKRYANKNNQTIGLLMGDVFTKKVNTKKHLLKIMDAWGIDETVIDDLANLNASQIVIVDERGTKYSISYADFVHSSVAKDFGHGRQLFVSRKYFTKT